MVWFTRTGFTAPHNLIKQPGTEATANRRDAFSQPMSIGTPGGVFVAVDSIKEVKV